jgi:hypothetical protein
MPSKIFIHNIAIIVIFVFNIAVIVVIIAIIVIIFFVRSGNHKIPGTLKF